MKEARSILNVSDEDLLKMRLNFLLVELPAGRVGCLPGIAGTRGTHFVLSCLEVVSVK